MRPAIRNIHSSLAIARAETNAADAAWRSRTGIGRAQRPFPELSGKPVSAPANTLSMAQINCLSML
jgi:hypothetical protein